MQLTDIANWLLGIGSTVASALLINVVLKVNKIKEIQAKQGGQIEIILKKIGL